MLIVINRKGCSLYAEIYTYIYCYVHYIMCPYESSEEGYTCNPRY